MTKEKEDKIIAQANEILQRRLENTIYIKESGGGTFLNKKLSLCI